MAWLIQAGATISSIKKILSGGKFKALAASPGAGSSDGLGRAFLESVMKRGIPGYVPRARPALDDGVAPVVIQFATSFDDEQAALIDYLIEAQCTPRRLAQVLDNREMEQNILNAKQHEREASIVAQAGRVGAVTISTNMAGRGTDILLGGNPEFMAREEFRKAPEKYRDQGINPEPPNSPPAGSPPEALKAYADEYSRWRENWEKFLARFRSVTDVEHEQVVAVGGLHILGTERHESRRIDNQLRGRAGRQGDPGSSTFYLSLQDDLMRIFARDWVSSFMQKLGMEEGVAIESRMISKRIQAAQKAVEAQNFESRKHLLEYDDVMNKQRETIYGLRRELLEGQDQKVYITDAMDRVVDWLASTYCPKDKRLDEWNVEGLKKEAWARFGIDLRKHELKFDSKTWELLKTELARIAHERYDEREKVWGEERMRQHERM
ncbi:MAG: hypothetical protein DMG21_09520, partial [Acidobacteria bacterium]